MCAVLMCVFTPGEYGIPRPWYFIFQVNFWIGVPLEAGMPIPPAPTEEDESMRFRKLLYISTCCCFLTLNVFIDVQATISL